MESPFSQSSQQSTEVIETPADKKTGDIRQTTLFGTIPHEENNVEQRHASPEKLESEPKAAVQPPKTEYTDEYIKKYLSSAHGSYLFDMRYWKRADRTEIVERLQSGWKDATNDGHGNLLIRTWLERGKPIDEITDFLMSIRDRQIVQMRDSWRHSLCRHTSHSAEHFDEVYSYYVGCCRALGQKPEPANVINEIARKKGEKNDDSTPGEHGITEPKHDSFEQAESKRGTKTDNLQLEKTAATKQAPSKYSKGDHVRFTRLDRKIEGVVKEAWWSKGSWHYSIDAGDTLYGSISERDILQVERPAAAKLPTTLKRGKPRQKTPKTKKRRTKREARTTTPAPPAMPKSSGGMSKITEITAYRAGDIFGDKAIDPEKDVVSIKTENKARLVLSVPRGTIFRDGEWHVFDRKQMTRSVGFEKSRFGAFTRRYERWPCKGLEVETVKNAKGFLTIAT